MNNEILDINSIEFEDELMRFLRKEMTAHEEEAFAELLKSNEQLREHAISIARLAKGLKKTGSEKDNNIIRNLDNADEKSIKKVVDHAIKSNKQSNTLKIKPWFYSFSVAASIALIIFASFKYYNYKQTLALGEEYEMTFTLDNLTRGGDDEATKKEIIALCDNIHNRIDLENSIAKLEHMWAESTSDYYNVYTDYSTEIGYTLAIAHLKNNDKEKAKTVLEKLITVAPQDSEIGDKVIEIIEKI